mgnify:CR=1 FL=1
MQSASAENYIVANATGSVDVYFDNSKKLETTSGGLKVTGITTLTDRLHVEAGISTFDADVNTMFTLVTNANTYHQGVIGDTSNGYTDGNAHTYSNTAYAAFITGLGTFQTALTLRITEISNDGGKFKKGLIKAELDIQENLWFFDCHFKGDPVMPGCLGLDAMWQLLGFYPVSYTHLTLPTILLV